MHDARVRQLLAVRCEHWVRALATSHRPYAPAYTGFAQWQRWAGFVTHRMRPWAKWFASFIETGLRFLMQSVISSYTPLLKHAFMARSLKLSCPKVPAMVGCSPTRMVWDRGGAVAIARTTNGAERGAADTAAAHRGAIVAARRGAARAAVASRLNMAKGKRGYAVAGAGCVWGVRETAVHESGAASVRDAYPAPNKLARERNRHNCHKSVWEPLINREQNNQNRAAAPGTRTARAPSGPSQITA